MWHSPPWLNRWAASAPAQVGVAGASWSIAGTYARGLLPRSPAQQAIVTGAIAAIHYQLTATSWAAMQASVALPGQRPGLRANMVVSGIGIAGGLTAMTLGNRYADKSLAASLISTTGRVTSFAAFAGGATAIWNDVLFKRLRITPSLASTVLPSVATGAVVVAGTLYAKHRRIEDYGIVAPERKAVKRPNAVAAARAAGIGVASGAAFAAATTTEQFLAHAMEHGMTRIFGREPGALGTLVAHGTVLTAMAIGGIAGLRRITTRIERRDDIIEPAYPEPPTSPHVSAGPRSSMPFDSLGKEGRRFVLMALSETEITHVMGEPAKTPVRVVGGYESAEDLAERVQLTLQDMDDCGAFDRSVICVGVPTGVGYFNYSIAEALEYLTRGDCAIVVPQYALVPSALALTATQDGIELTRLLLLGIQARLSGKSEAERPHVILIGESLGANIALDLATLQGHSKLANIDALGVHGGLYLGVPFRSSAWHAWRDDSYAVDDSGRLMLVSQPDEVDAPVGWVGRHMMVVHHDDPVNKYGYQMVLRPPWWMGAPDTRPPLVPRESKFRPITTFALATVDLFNGMQSKPGTFLRRGHDYRIDIVQGLKRTFGFTSSDQQTERIEDALRSRESEWSTRRKMAWKLAKIRRTLGSRP